MVDEIIDAPDKTVVAANNTSTPTASVPALDGNLTGGQSDAFSKVLDPSNYQALTSDMGALTQRRIKEQEQMTGRELAQAAQYDARQERVLSAIGSTMDDLKPWNADQQMAKYSHNLWEDFGSPGFIIGMIASQFTGMPMTSALNAGAAAINAINTGDDAAYHKAFDAWKDNTNLTLKRIDIEQNAFNDIDHLRKNRMDEWHVAAEAAAARFNDQRLLTLLQHGMDPEAIKVIGEMSNLKLQLSKANDAIETNEKIRQYVRAHLTDKDGKPTAAASDPKKWLELRASAEEALKSDVAHPLVHQVITSDEYLNADNAKQQDMLYDAVKKENETRYFGRGVTSGQENVKDREAIKVDIRKKHPDWSEGQIAEETNKRVSASKTSITANKRFDVESHIRQYDVGIETIDKVVDVLDNYAGAAGLAGRGTRLAERIENIFGGNDTDRVQMMRNIELLQTMGPRLLLDQRTGRPLSAEAGHISNIIAGLNMGDTTANTLRSMQEIRDLFEELKKGNVESLSGGKPETTTPAPASKPSAKPWENDPVVH